MESLWDGQRIDTNIKGYLNLNLNKNKKLRRQTTLPFFFLRSLWTERETICSEPHNLYNHHIAKEIKIADVWANTWLQVLHWLYPDEYHKENISPGHRNIPQQIQILVLHLFSPPFVNRSNVGSLFTQKEEGRNIVAPSHAWSELAVWLLSSQTLPAFINKDLACSLIQATNIFNEVCILRRIYVLWYVMLRRSPSYVVIAPCLFFKYILNKSKTQMTLERSHTMSVHQKLKNSGIRVWNAVLVFKSRRVKGTQRGLESASWKTVNF